MKVLVRNDSPAPFAVPVATLDAQGKVLETQWTPVFGGTEDDRKDETQLDFRRENVAAVVIDPGYLTPQLNRRDDHMQTNRLFAARWSRLQLRPLAQRGALGPKPPSTGYRCWGPTPPISSCWGRLSTTACVSSQEIQLPGHAHVQLQPQRAERYRDAEPEHAAQADTRSRQLLTGVQVQRFERYRKVEPSMTLLLPHSAFNRAPAHACKLANTAMRRRRLDRHQQYSDAGVPGAAGNALQNWSAHVELNHLTSRSQPKTIVRASRRCYAWLRLRTAAIIRLRKQVRARLFGGAFCKRLTDHAFYHGPERQPRLPPPNRFPGPSADFDAYTAQRTRPTTATAPSKLFCR